MRKDIETKKQDLRIMVGERYRDLLEAADSVQAMKDAAVRIQSVFLQVQEGCDVNVLKNEVRKELEKGKDTALEEKKRLIYPVAAQIKLLVDTPEQVVIITLK
ncbi:Golgi transport complex subunit 1 [Irineochytrium annulatum]|nr:Golgi transport complex subunit 1 [Irineochytrium annulatum]